MPYVVNLFLTIFLGLIPGINSPESKRRKYYMIAVASLLIFVSGLRGTYTLSDTDSYTYTYKMAGVPFKYYMSMCGGDYLFYIVCWIFSHIGFSFQFFLVIESTFVIGTFCYFIYKNSLNPMISMVIYEATFLNVWMAAVRQAIAMALMVWVYEFIKSGKKKLAIVLCVAAIMFHATGIVFVLFLLFRRIEVTDKFIASFLIITAGLWVFRNQFLKFINVVAEAFDRNQYTTFYSETPTNLILLTALVLLVALVVRKKLLSEYKQYQDCYCGIFLMMCMLALGGGTMVRLAWYFGISMCLIIPVIIKCVVLEQRRLTIFCVLMALALLYMKSVDLDTYYFFWEK